MSALLRILAALVLSLAGLHTQAVTIYDATLGLPATQGWTTLSIGNAGSESVTAGLYTTDSRGVGVDTWGKSRLSPITLNTATGFTLDFTLRINDETHSNNNRAGFSLLFVGADPTRSLELAFWTNEVWAYQHTGSAFVHGAGAGLDTTSALRSYTLAVSNQQFTLSTGGSLLFGGALQNYTPQGLPYTLPGFVFFGDNTSSGAASATLGSIAIAAVPEAGMAWLWIAGGAIVLARTGRRRVR